MEHKKKWIAMAVMASFGNSIVNQLLNFVLGLHFGEYDMELTAMGLHFSFFALGAVVVRILILRIIRAENVKKIAVTGLGVMALSCAGYLVLENGVWFIICRTVQGAAFGAASSSVPTITMEYMDSSAHSVSLIGITAVTASLAGPPAAIFIYGKYGFMPVCIMAVISALTAMVLCLLLPWKKQTERKGTRKNKMSVYTKGVIPYFIGTVLFLVLCNCYMILLTLFAEEAGYLRDASVYLTASALLAMMIRLAFSFLVKSGWLSRAFVISAVLYFLTITWMVCDTGIWSMAVSGAANGLFSGIMMSWMHFEIIEKAGGEGRAKANNHFYCLQDIANILCGGFWSLIAGAAGYAAGFIISGLGVMATAVVFAAYMGRAKSFVNSAGK